MIIFKALKALKLPKGIKEKSPHWISEGIFNRICFNSYLMRS